MKRVITAAGAALFLSTLSIAPAMAGPIDRACMSSDRGGNRALCGCIQAVANMTLNGRDQRLAAKFFSKPQMAQDIRMSKTRDHDAFWKRYEQFGATASATCS